MRDLPQYQHADLGLIPDCDHTDDLRPGKSEAPEVAASEASEPPTLTRK